MNSHKSQKNSQILRIKDFCIVGDGAHASINRQDSGIMYLTSKNFKPFGLDLSAVDFISESDYEKYFGYSRKALTTPSEGDVLFGIIGSLGVPHVVREDDFFGISSSVAILRPKKGLAPKYLYYFMTSSAFQGAIDAIKSGVAQSFLSLEMIRNLPLIVPDLPVQRKIAAVLSAYDDLIENNTRRIALLEKMAEEIYREWFVRLRFPGHEQITFHKGIPEGWATKRFDEFCLLQRGYDLPNANVQPGPYPVLASTSIKTFHHQFKVKPPVITTGRSGSLGTVLLVNEPAWPLNTTLFVKKTFGNSHYLIYYTLKFLKLENFNSGAGVPTLNRNHLGGLKLPVPPKALQVAFDEKIAAIFQQQENLKKSTEVLKQTRDRLLTRLISGKLSIEDLDIHFPPSMQDSMPNT